LVRHPVLALQPDLKVTRGNEAFYRAFELDPEQVEGKPVYDIAKRQWNVARLRQLLEEILPAQGEVRDFRIDHQLGKGNRKSLLLNARQFYDESRGVQLILLAIEDATPK
jgi:chemotaxis protein methyltransferase CheR